MMGKKSLRSRDQINMVSLDALVPEDHLVRKLDAAIDFNFIRDISEGLYSPIGRKSIDPVVLVKITLTQYVFGIPSMRRTISEIQTNAAYRWFLGYGLLEEVPHFSTFGKNYSRRFAGSSLFEEIFSHILQEAASCGFIDEEKLFIDGSHVKASANTHKYRNEETLRAARAYGKELQAEIDRDREEHGKGPLKEREGEAERKDTKVSTTDPESGYFHKGEHKQVFAYGTNTCCDRHGFIPDFEVTPGNVHDSVSFWPLYERLKKRQGSLYYVMDAGYKVPAIARQLLLDGKVPVLPYKRPMTKKGFFKKSEYAYDEHYDCYICPWFQTLEYSTTNREGYREYKSVGEVCEKCPYLSKCTGSRNHVKVVTRHVWEGYMEKAEDIRHTTGMAELYRHRKETIERVFADGKEKHGMRYTQYRGLAKVKMELTLMFACMNLKKMASWKWKNSGGLHPDSVSLRKSPFLLLQLKNSFGILFPKLFCLQSEKAGIPAFFYS